MTLRLRLVLALVALVAVGLALFGAATYTLYARSQYGRLDDQMQSSIPFVTRQLDGDGPHGEPHGNNGGAGDRPAQVPVSTYAELRDSEGAVVATSQLTGSDKPDLEGKTDLHGSQERYFTTGSTQGSGSWRVMVTGAADGSLVVAVPTGDVTTALHRLLLIEIGGGAALVAVLSAGSWLVLRRGLHPLESMAGTASEIADGDLTRRVSPSGGPTEVGRLGFALNTMLDEIQAAFAERDATEHRLRQFLADASHELRTPLTSIQGFAELFRISEPDRVDVPLILRRIEGESARMKGLVEDLLLLARLDQTRERANDPVDLSVLAADACSDAHATAPDRTVTLDAPAPVVVTGDEPLLRQALANLLTNALRHTPDGTPIEVATCRLDGQAIVTVHDHGAGLTDEAIPHVFNRFWQADRARVGTGSGLGLAIVAGIVADHDGTAEAANANDGGAVFTLRLPVAVDVS